MSNETMNTKEQNKDSVELTSDNFATVLSQETMNPFVRNGDIKVPSDFDFHIKDCKPYSKENYRFFPNYNTNPKELKASIENNGAGYRFLKANGFDSFNECIDFMMAKRGL